MRIQKLSRNFSNDRKKSNIVWKVQRDDGSKGHSFKHIVELEVEHFWQIYKEDNKDNIVR
jgi:hypothetical protein